MLTLHTPAYEDLWFRQRMLEDEETMSYNRAWGGTIPFPEEAWRPWYDFWIVHHENRRYYRYLKNEDGEFVGEIAYHVDEETGDCLADVIVYSPFRGRGYGSRGLEMLCAAAKEMGIAVLCDDIAAGNPAMALFLKQGFFEISRTEEKIILKKTL